LDKYISCLSQINESIRESNYGDFEFTDPREAVVFAQFTGAILPISIDAYFKLDPELGKRVEAYGWHPLLSQPAWSYEMHLFQKRRYVKFAELTRFAGEEFWFDESAYKREVDTLEKKGLDPKEFVFYDLNKKAWTAYDETFWEYLGGCYFRRKGYAITRWKPRKQEGDPDACAFRTSMLNPLRKEGWIREGCFLCELDIFKVFGKVYGESKTFDDRTIVLEAESSKKTISNGIKQLAHTRREDKWKAPFLHQGFYDEGYVVGPDYPEKDDFVGIISNDNGNFYFNQCPKLFSQDEPRKKAIEEFELFVKLVVARNLQASKIRNWVSDESSFWNYLKAIEESIQRKSITELLRNVKEG